MLLGEPAPSQPQLHSRALVGVGVRRSVRPLPRGGGASKGASTLHGERALARATVDGRLEHVGGLVHLTEAEDADAVEVGEALLEPLDRRRLRGAQRHARVVFTFVRLVLALGVADLRLQVVVVLGLVLLDAVPVGPLRVGVNVHLDDAVRDRLLDVGDVGARAAVEDERDRLRALRQAELLGDVHLRVAQYLRVEPHVARRVDTMDVAKGGGDGELGVDGGELLLDLPDLLRLGVEVLGVDVLVIDAVLLAAGDAQLHLQQHVELRHLLEVLGADLEVLVHRLLRQVDHVRREERLAMRGKVPLRRGEHAIEPRQQFLAAVVGVQYDGHAVLLGHGAHMEGARHGAGDRGLEVGVVEALARVKLAAAR
mmetsp:Transcript_24628/g.61175  ORF Transcript_24628/g.61175 Transcript_24628/m.61175 type:complete len:369 (+) Transcript_24628:314-1420(+)